MPAGWHNGKMPYGHFMKSKAFTVFPQQERVSSLISILLQTSPTASPASFWRSSCYTVKAFLEESSLRQMALSPSPASFPRGGLQHPSSHDKPFKKGSWSQQSHRRLGNKGSLINNLPLDHTLLELWKSCGWNHSITGIHSNNGSAQRKTEKLFLKHRNAPQLQYTLLAATSEQEGVPQCLWVMREQPWSIQPFSWT